MRVLVTGHRGFLGRHLAQALLARGDDVVQAEGDIRGEGTWSGVPPVDAVVHLAAQSHVPESVRDPAGTWSANVGGTLRLLEWARERKPGRMVLASSSHVYGIPRSNPVDEEHPLVPRSPYGASKMAAEALACGHGAAYGLDVVRVRPFNIYGPGQAPGFLVPDILGPLSRGEAPRLGDPSPRRDFTFVADAVAFLLAALDRPGLAGEAVNLGSGQGWSVEDVAKAAVAASGLSLEPEFTRAPRPGDVAMLVADVRKARRLLGWAPATSLAEGLRACWEATQATTPRGAA